MGKKMGEGGGDKTGGEEGTETGKWDRVDDARSIA